MKAAIRQFLGQACRPPITSIPKLDVCSVVVKHSGKRQRVVGPVKLLPFFEGQTTGFIVFIP